MVLQAVCGDSRIGNDHYGHLRFIGRRVAPQLYPQDLPLPRLDTSRLRATWLADCAEQLGLATFMAAAGISCSQRLGDLAAGLEPAGEAEAVRLLGAARLR